MLAVFATDVLPPRMLNQSGRLELAKFRPGWLNIVPILKLNTALQYAAVGLKIGLVLVTG